LERRSCQRPCCSDGLNKLKGSTGQTQLQQITQYTRRAGLKSYRSLPSPSACAIAPLHARTPASGPVSGSVSRRAAAVGAAFGAAVLPTALLLGRLQQVQRVDRANTASTDDRAHKLKGSFLHPGVPRPKCPRGHRASDAASLSRSAGVVRRKTPSDLRHLK